ncbi:MAG TPA: hypothetical protein P5568_07210 [Acidobacteriota bacterium]|jgi:ketosteroid isomerase-like protein|nr:hypothetical protein [Acidobacteriota bacterium]
MLLKLNKRDRFGSTAVLVLAVALLACGQDSSMRKSADLHPGGATAEPGGPVLDLVKAWTTALNRRPLSVEAFYHADAVLLWPGREVSPGSREIERYLQDALADVTSFTYQSQSRGVEEHFAWENGRFVVAFADPSAAQAGSILRVLQLDADGNWRIVREAWNFLTLEEGEGLRPQRR